MGEKGKISEKGVYLGAGSLTLACFFFFLFVLLPPAYYHELLFGRPEEFNSALFFLLALTGYLQKGAWKDDSFEHWVVLSLVVGFMCQAMFMSFSHRLFDMMFDMAHLLKKVSYICTLIGLLVSMYYLFRRAELSAEILTKVNKDLQKEITARRKVEETLCDSESRIRTILDTAVDGIIIIDERGIVLMFNQAAERIFGYRAEEALDRNVALLMSKPDKSAHNGYISNYLKTGIKKIIGIGREVTGQRKDGTKFPMELSVSEVPLTEKVIFTGFLRDITDRKQAEEKLRTSEERLSGFMESATDAFFLFDSELNLVDLNETGSRLFGLNKEEVVGKNILDLSPGIKETGRYDKYRKVIKTGEPLFINDFVPHPKFGNIHLALKAFKAGEGLGYIVTDITELKKTEEEMREALSIKSAFTSTVSHELRTPLTAIKEGIGIVLDGSAGEINEDQKDFLDTAKRNVDRLHRLINDVLDFTKLESGKAELRMKENDINKTIEEATATQKSVAEGKGLYLKTSLSSDLEKIEFDSDRIVQVLTNLLNNAIKFTAKGGITVESGRDAQEKAVRVQVEDTGPGIKKEDFSKLFVEFQQVGGSKYRKPGSTGLGLAICKQIVAGHGGRIWVESVEGAGADFIFTLPLKQEG